MSTIISSFFTPAKTICITAASEISARIKKEPHLAGSNNPCEYTGIDSNNHYYQSSSNYAFPHTALLLSVCWFRKGFFRLLAHRHTL